MAVIPFLTRTLWERVSVIIKRETLSLIKNNVIMITSYANKDHIKLSFMTIRFACILIVFKSSEEDS